MHDAILVVDDERNFCTGIQFFLEQNNFTAHLAYSGSEAFVQLRQHHYQAVILDLILPDIDGIELAEYITNNYPDIAVIILTGHASMDSAIRAIRYGVLDYLHKPCRPELVLQILKRCIETKRLKHELVTSKRKFQQLAAATWEGIAFFNDGVVLQCNNQFCELFGHSEQTLVGRHLKEIIEDWEDCVAELENQNSVIPAIVESAGIYYEGTSFPLEIRIRKISSDRELTWVGAFRDISVRKREERNRLKMQEELAHAQRMESIGLMAGSVAHDLNNILTAIVTFPELMLLDTSMSEKFRNDITRIRKAGKQAADVVSDLLTVARGATSSKKVSNLNTILAEYSQSIEFTQLQQQNPEIEVSFELEPNLANIEASDLHLSQSIINLATNGFEAITEVGKIDITTQNVCLQKTLHGYESIPAGSYVLLSVRDTGTGIPQSGLSKIFEPFYSKKELGHSGTGLGLTVIWNTVRDHHGYIDLETGDDGSCFKLYFPICYDKEQKTSKPAAIDSLTGSGQTILVVDDESSQLEVTASLLRRLNYTPIIADNGTEAIEFIKEHPVDLILLDLWMDPGIDGYETYRRMLKISPSQKAIITSGYFRPEDYKTAEILGITQSLTKPYSIRNLAHALWMEMGTTVT